MAKPVRSMPSLKDDKTEENAFEILQHYDRNINKNSI